MNIKIILLITVSVLGVSIFFYVNPPFSYYDLEIHGMKDVYHVGEEYSFYYTLTGYGNTCHSWIVAYPDESGTIQHKGEAIDCLRPTNKELDYDSRTDLRQFNSKMPMIEGKYNVTVSLENLESVVHEVTVLSKGN